MPVKDLVCGFKGEKVPKDMLEIAKGLPYRDFMTVGLLVNKLNLKMKQISQHLEILFQIVGYMFTNQKQNYLEFKYLITGHHIANRAFYGIMGSKMLTAKDGKYTNAVYGFLAIMFKNIEDLKPDYMAVSFDLKAPTARHKMYEGYKANRHGMPEELAQQMPMIKEVLKAMKIDIVQKEGFEGDDILGTLAKYGEEQGLDVIILSGDRDIFQLATDRVTIRIPRTKAGKTETEEYDKNKIFEEYGLEPKALIEVKGLQGDSSDNIPGVPGIGPKTAINLIKKYNTIENLYKAIDEGKDDLKGKQKENIVENREKAFLSRTLGEINNAVPLDDDLNTLKVEEWDKEEVLKLFEEWNFKKYIERFDLNKEKSSGKSIDSENKSIEDIFEIIGDITEDVIKTINSLDKIVYYLGLEDTKNEEYIIKKKIISIGIFDYEKNKVYYIKSEYPKFYELLKNVFEDPKKEKFGIKMTNDYIILKQMGIHMQNIKFDVEVASYILNPTEGKYPIDKLTDLYLNLNIEDYLLKKRNIRRTKTNNFL